MLFNSSGGGFFRLAFFAFPTALTPPTVRHPPFPANNRTCLRSAGLVVSRSLVHYGRPKLRNVIVGTSVITRRPDNVNETPTVLPRQRDRRDRLNQLAVPSDVKTLPANEYIGSARVPCRGFHHTHTHTPRSFTKAQLRLRLGSLRLPDDSGVLHGHCRASPGRVIRARVIIGPR